MQQTPFLRKESNDFFDYTELQIKGSEVLQLPFQESLHCPLELVRNHHWQEAARSGHPS